MIACLLYSSSSAASGGVSPYSYAVTSGALPAGLTLNATTGAITGTPTSTTSQTFTITATDANGCTGSRTSTLNPNCPVITLNPATLPFGTVGVAYSQTLTTTGGITPYTYSVSSCTLPADLSRECEHRGAFRHTDDGERRGRLAHAARRG